MYILESMEVRWFLKDSAALKPLFTKANREPERVDEYLVTGTDAVAVKVRGGSSRLETKYRLGTLRAVSLGADITGTIEHWNKISVESEGASKRPGRWVRISKRRSTIHYGFDGTNVKLGSSGSHGGCNVELTELGEEASGFTFGFEAFGYERPLEILVAACRAFFAGNTLSLHAVDSYGYGAWVDAQYHAVSR